MPELTLKATQAAPWKMDGITGEIVIVDSDSQDGSLELLSRAVAERGWGRDNRVRRLESGWNGGFGAGNDFGIRAGMSWGDAPDFVHVPNSDAWPEPGAIRHLRDFLMTNPKAGMAGSHVRGPDGDPHRCLFPAAEARDRLDPEPHRNRPRRLGRRCQPDAAPPDADEIGLFDETPFLYVEKTDLYLRAARAGWQ